MKIRTKLCLIAAALFAGGILLFVIGMSTLGWDFVKLDGSKYTAKSYNVDRMEQTENIEISLSSFPLDIVSGSELGLEYFEASDSLVVVEHVNGTLKIVEKRLFNPFVTGLFSVGRKDHRFVLTVPNGMNVSIKGPNSSMHVTGVHLRSLRIDVTNLDLNMEATEIDEVFNISATDVVADLYSTSAYSMTVSAVNMNMDMEFSTFIFASFRNTNANIDIDRSTIKELTVSGTNIDMDCKWPEMETCDIKGTNVVISSERTKLDKLTVKGTNLNADIEINGLKSEYSVVTQGFNLPPEQEGNTDKTISLSGTNNRVKLEFVISA